MMLREEWGSRSIPNWCPFLREQVKIQKRQSALRKQKMSGTHLLPKENSDEK
jgi:hypothetical protein